MRGSRRQQADEILNELRQIRQLLEKQGGTAAPPSSRTPALKLNLEGFAMLGSQGCSAHHRGVHGLPVPILPELPLDLLPRHQEELHRHRQSPLLQQDLPLDLHANAMRAALAARCAGEQSGFWSLRNVMGSNPDKLDLEHIIGFAADLKLDTAKLRTCITSEKYKEAVQTDLLDAMRIGANGTPSFVVGKSTADWDRWRTDGGRTPIRPVRREAEATGEVGLSRKPRARLCFAR